jgi:8-amino-7-oxononanoate synthase
MKTTHTDPLEWIDEELALLAERGLRRALAAHSGPQQVQLHVAGRDLVNFGSNDYLGLAADSRLSLAAARAAEAEGWGAGASPLITGRAAAHRQLEERLAEFEGTEAALVFSSGYAANVGTIAALAARGDAIYSDDKNHASMIDGARLSRADVHVFPHRDARALEAMLRGGGDHRRRLIISESVFSMDGDLAPLAELADLAERFDCMLLVDEAHATGVFGRHGRGLSEELGVEDRVAVRIGTLSKSLGSAGGFVCGSAALVEWLVNRARSYVFSTALPPAVCAASMAALEIMSQEPGRRIELRRQAADLREKLRLQGWNLANSESQIIPLVVGEANAVMRLAASLLEQGILAPAIRPPSVPAGESLVRISLSHAHTSEMVERLVAALLRCGPSSPRLQ